MLQFLQTHRCACADCLTEIQTQKSHRISKDFEGAVTLQDAGMQTLEVNVYLGHALVHFMCFT